MVIVGGGPAGLVAAKEARRHRASVLMVQRGRIGGDCTFTGCVPSKTLLAAAAAGTSFDAAMARVHRTVERIAATENATALSHHGIDVIDGFARFTSPRSIDVDGTPVRAGRFIVSTGARPTMPPIDGLRDARPLTSDTLFRQDRQPASMIVLGGGPIGCEMAQAFARLGTSVVLVEALDRVLPREEPETSVEIAWALTSVGVDVRCGIAVQRAERRSDGAVAVHMANGAELTADELLVAIGRTPAGHGLGLEDLGVVVDHRGAIEVDTTMATAVKGIWAAGDVTGGLQFTHAAGRMGWVAAANACWRVATVKKFRFNSRVVPWATFTTPEVGRVGLTEAEAAVAHPRSKVALLPLSDVDRAIATGTDRGFVKLIAAPRRGLGHLGGGRLVGATVVAPTGGDLVHEAALAMQANLFVGRIAQTVHAYPTWATAMQQAALQFFGTSVGHTARPVRGG